MAKSQATVIDIQTSPALKSLNDLRKQINDLKTALYGLSESSEEYKDKLMELGYAQDEMNSFMAKTRQGCSALAGSYNALSYEMGVLKQAYHETNDEAKRNELAEQINGINDKLKEMDEAVGNHSRNVGNYTKSMTEAFQNVGITIGNINPLFANLANGMVDAGSKGGTAFQALGTSAKGLGSQLKALVANPVGAVIMAIVVAVKAATAIFNKFKESVNRNEEASNNMAKALAPIKAIVNGLTNVFDDFVEMLTKVAAGIGEAVSAAMEFLGLADERVKAENQIAEMEKQNAELSRQYTVENAKLELEAQEAKRKSQEKDKLSNEERIAYLQEYADKETKIADNELDMATKKYELLKKQSEQGKNNAEINNQLAEAEANMYRVQAAHALKMTELTGQMAELNNQIAAEQEKKDKEAKDRAKKYQEEVKKLKDEYKSLLQTMNDALFGGNYDYQLRQAHKTQTDEIKKLDELYKKHAISKKQYNEAIALSNQKLALAEQKIIEERQAAVIAFTDKYNQMTQNNITLQIKAVEDKYADMAKDIDKMMMTDDENGNELLSFEKAQEMKTELGRKQAEELRKLRNELYTKEIQDYIALQQTGEDELLAYKTAKNKQDLQNRIVNAREYLQNEIDMQIEYNLQMKATNEQALTDLQTLYQNNLIDEETYLASVQNLETAIIEIDTQTAQLLQEKKDIVVDGWVNALSTMTDMMSEYGSAITSIGEGISSEWSNVFSSMTDGIAAVGQALKTGEKGWSKYGQIAISSLNVASSIMTALADELDTNTKEGFEQQKKYQIAAVTMNMLAGIANAWVSAMSPENAWMTVWGQLAMGTAMTALLGTMGALQISKIKQTLFDGGDSTSSSSSTSTPNISSLSDIVSPVQYTTDITGASTEENVTDTRVYVLESDIANTTNKVNVAERESRY